MTYAEIREMVIEKNHMDTEYAEAILAPLERKGTKLMLDLNGVVIINLWETDNYGYTVYMYV